MKNTKDKLIVIISLILMLLTTITYSFANTVITEDKFQESVKGWCLGQKTATATVNNGTYTVGKGSDLGEVAIEFKDGKAIMSVEALKVEVEYDISNTQASFTINSDITKDTEPTYAIFEHLKPDLLVIYFLSITDLYEIDANKALEYYEKAIEDSEGKVNLADNIIEYAKEVAKSKKDITNDVFTQKTNILIDTDDEVKYATTLKINLDKINNITNTSGNINKNETNNTPTNNSNLNTTKNTPVTNTNKNISSKNISTTDTTKSTKILSKAGINKSILLIVIIIFIIAIISNNKVKKYQGIE